MVSAAGPLIAAFRQKGNARVFWDTKFEGSLGALTKEMADKIAEKAFQGFNAYLADPYARDATQSHPFRERVSLSFASDKFKTLNTLAGDIVKNTFPFDEWNKRFEDVNQKEESTEVKVIGGGIASLGSGSASVLKVGFQQKEVSVDHSYFQGKLDEIGEMLETLVAAILKNKMEPGFSYKVVWLKTPSNAFSLASKGFQPPELEVAMWAEQDLPEKNSSDSSQKSQRKKESTSLFSLRNMAILLAILCIARYAFTLLSGSASASVLKSKVRL